MEIHRYRLDNGVSCAVAPGMGCNLFSWIVDGSEVFHVDKDFGTDPSKFFYGGNPVLFPAVGRTWDRTGPTPRFGFYAIHGLRGEYRMPMHGLLQSAECSLREEEIGSEAVRLRYDVRLPEAVRRESYPFDVSLALTYTLERRSLLLRAEITNRGNEIAPYSYGYHPWFAVSDPQRRGVEVLLPCTYMRTLDPDLVVPDGGKRELAGPLRFEPDVGYGGVYSGLSGRRATLTDGAGGRRITVDVDETICDFVISSPKGTPAVCVEPWTAGLGAYGTLRHEDWETVPAMGLIPPGAAHTVVVRYGVESVGQ